MPQRSFYSFTELAEYWDKRSGQPGQFQQDVATAASFPRKTSTLDNETAEQREFQAEMNLGCASRYGEEI